MDQIDVVWLSYHDNVLARGYWDQGILEDIFKQGNFKHYEGFVQDGEPENKNAYSHGDGAIVIVNGRTHETNADEINRDIARLQWVLFIETGDEESVFPWRDIKHPLMKVWLQLPRMTEHDDTHFKLPNGYRPDTHDELAKIEPSERNIDYLFIGQVNHERRQQCFDVATQFKTVYPTAIVEKTEGFGSDQVKYPDYLKLLTKSKIALCPSGVESADNFRLYEALEAGCLPVVDAFSTNFKTAGFWKYLFGSDVPFPIVDYWDAFPNMIPHLLSDFPANANRCFAWWQGYKRKIKWQLLDDVKELAQ